jgi:hypothetical protein
MSGTGGQQVLAQAKRSWTPRVSPPKMKNHPYPPLLYRFLFSVFGFRLIKGKLSIGYTVFPLK